MQYIKIGDRELSNIHLALIALGQVSGLVMAYRMGGGFWKYVGFFIVGGMAGGAVGLLIAPPKPIEDENNA